MIRNFQTHQIRKTVELSDRLWDFTPMEGSQKGITQKVWVPSCLETYPGMENYRGKAVYETSFFAEGTIRICFKGVSHYAKVWIDGELSAEHYGSYGEFSAYARDLKAGIHSLRVEVDNQFKEEYSLDFPNDYYSYGGISRGVVLEQLNEVFVQWVHVTPIKKEHNDWEVKVEVCCRNLTNQVKDYELQIVLTENEKERKRHKADIKVPTGESVVYSEILEIKDGISWTMENAFLYMVYTQLVEKGTAVDDFIDRFGLRTVRIAGEKILFNEKLVNIKGVCRHEDHPDYGCALPPAMIWNDLKMIKDIGANSVRTVHYPNDEIFLDMCDELGILVWEESHARALDENQMRNPYFMEQSRQSIEEMIIHHYNHPSIYIWGMLNECASETEYGRTCYQELFETMKELDTSRPHSFASCKFYDDKCQDLTDICAWNMYPYWYEEDTAAERIEKLRDWLDTKGNAMGKPLLVTEIGAGAVYGFRSTAKEVWSEELQEEILRKQLTEIAESKDCIGMYIWQFCDVRVSREWAMRRPKSRNNKGIVDEYRKPKLSAATVKEIFCKISNYHN